MLANLNLCEYYEVALKRFFHLLHQCARALGMCCYVSSAEDGEVRNIHHDTYTSQNLAGSYYKISVTQGVL